MYGPKHEGCVVEVSSVPAITDDESRYLGVPTIITRCTT